MCKSKSYCFHLLFVGCLEGWADGGLEGFLEGLADGDTVGLAVGGGLGGGVGDNDGLKVGLAFQSIKLHEEKSNVGLGVGLFEGDDDGCGVGFLGVEADGERVGCVDVFRCNVIEARVNMRSMNDKHISDVRGTLCDL